MCTNLNYECWRTRIAMREFESTSDNSPITGLNRANLSAPAYPALLYHLGLHQAAPVHNQPITGAALWHRVAPNSATAATNRSNLAAMLNMGAPANGSRPASQQAGPADRQRSASVKKLSEQASRSFACAQQAPYAGILVAKTWSLETSSDQRAAPADKLRIGSGAPHRAPLVMFPDGGRTHPIRPPPREGRWKRPERRVDESRGKRVRC
jgi:hypothetical protein